jgi:hypothetical protein
MNVISPKSENAKPFFICQNKKTSQYLWIAFEVWEDRHTVSDAFKFSSVPQIVDFFEWQERNLDNYDIVQVEYVLKKVEPPYLKKAAPARKRPK